MVVSDRYEGNKSCYTVLFDCILTFCLTLSLLIMTMFKCSELEKQHDMTAAAVRLKEEELDAKEVAMRRLSDRVQRFNIY